MKQKTLLTIGVVGTVVLMTVLALSVLYYMDDPNNTMGMVAMSSMSTGLMMFLVIFAVFYTKPGSNSDRYMELYQGICSGCGAKFGEDGICPGCGRKRPSK